MGQPIPKGGGAYKVGNPYRINGVLFTPAADPSYDRAGIASFYSEDFHGRKTANGEIFDMWALTAAHPTLPMPSYAYVTNLANGRTLLVRINDRGPYARDRVIDLSRASARLLGFEMQGTAPVRVRYAGPAPLNGDDHYEQRFLAAQPWYRFAGWRGAPVLQR
jgi:rare lipoprotein A